MTTTTQTLADWLLACIAEDEAGARRSHGPIQDAVNRSLACRADDVVFVHRQDPAHVLAVCAAHRAIVEMHQPTMLTASHCAVCADYQSSYHEPWPCPTLRALALAYADRPGFREEWR